MDKKCCICGSSEKIWNIHISHGGFKPGEVHLDDSVFICEECLNKCEICQKCKKKIPTSEIRSIIGNWDSFLFCDCPKKSIEIKNNNLVKKKDYIKAQKNETVVNKVNYDEISDYILTIGCDYYILDCCLASIFEITTRKLRIITKTHIDSFDKYDIHRLNSYDINILKQDMPEYVTTINPYAFNIHGVIKLSYFLSTDKSKLFSKKIIESLLKNELFYIDDEVLQNLYDTLTSSYSYTKIKEKVKQNLNKMKELQDEVNYLNEQHIKSKALLEKTDYYKTLFKIFLFLFIVFFFLFYASR